MSNESIGSSLDDFLEEEGILAECQAEAMRRVLTWQINEYLEKKGVKKAAFARQLGTSRSQLDRLLDPENISLNLRTLARGRAIEGK